jgi:PAT family acetyl-CoA transporter-like MFS transporter 1
MAKKSSKDKVDPLQTEVETLDGKKVTLREDMPNLILLVILYTFQGLPMGMFLQSVPLLFKKYLTYQELGIIALCTMPYSFKVLWSPIVELYYMPAIGKRKTWVVSM